MHRIVSWMSPRPEPEDIDTYDGSTRFAFNDIMTAAEILPLLSLHGCKDITSQLNTSQVGPAIRSGHGGFSNVHLGVLQNGDQVAVKCLRIHGLYDSYGDQFKFAAHELHIQSKYRHRNILELLGVANYKNQIAMVSPWIENGDLTRYLSKHPKADLYDLVRDMMARTWIPRHNPMFQKCSQVTEAVAYLKENNVVHGDIKGENILISEDHIPKLTGFGNSALSKYTTLPCIAGNETQPRVSLRWAAPEIIKGRACTFESDVYALGMASHMTWKIERQLTCAFVSQTILEAFTGSAPYANLNDLAAMQQLKRGIPPKRPQKCIGGEFPDALWNLLTRSWDVVPENRPTAQSMNTMVAMTRLRVASDHRISGSSNEFAILSLLILHGCEDITSRLDMSKLGPAICNGGFGNVHRGTLQNGDQVAVKCLRMHGLNDSNDKQLKLAAHELYVWSKCCHRNILELLGVASYNNQIAMVSPWMTNGDLHSYLSKYPEADRYNLCSQIADAVAYLKDKKMVHGDIKGTLSDYPCKANVLISEDHVPKLTDFGTSVLSQYTLAFTKSNGSQLEAGISIRWTAPEILIDGEVNTFRSDVYALGMASHSIWQIEWQLTGPFVPQTILEAFTGSVPYANLRDRAVVGRLMRGIPPERPKEYVGDKFADALWILITSSWDAVPENRPSARRIRNVLMAITKAKEFDNRVERVAREFHNQRRVEVVARQSLHYTSGSKGDFDINVEVLALERDVPFIRNYFDGINIALEILDQESFAPRAISSHHNAGSATCMEWNEIRKGYNCLIRESGRLATAIKARAEDFKTNIIPPVGLQATHLPFIKVRKLRKMIADMEEADIPIKAMSQGFVKVPGSIRSFQRRLIKGGYSNQLKSGREKINNRIQDLNKEIERLVKLITQSEVEIEILEELRKDGPVEEGDTLGDRIILAIKESLGGRQEILGAIRAQDSLARAKDNLSATEMELQIIESGVLNLEHLIEPRAKATESNMNHVCGRLIAIAKIWAKVRADLEAFALELDHAQNASEEIEFRRLRLERSKIVPLYENLEKVLHRYANTVTD